MKKPKQTHPENDMRRRIMEAAFDLIADKGMDKVSVREIVQKVKVTKPVLYYYFKNKEDLCRQIFNCHLEDLNATLEKSINLKLSLEETIANIFKDHFELVKKHPKIPMFALKAMSVPKGSLAIILESVKKSRIKMLKDILSNAEQRGEIPPGTSDNILRLTDAIIVHSLVNARFKNKKDFDPELPGKLARIIVEGAKTVRQ